MRTIKTILSQTDHRSSDLPKGRWKYYQEWNHVLFLHWKVPYEILRPLVPESLHIDQINHQTYISLLAFTMQNIRPRNLPALNPLISKFNEVNIRTYVEKDGHKGVFFLSIEGGNPLSVFAGRNLSGFSYEKATIFRKKGVYRAVHKENHSYLNTGFTIGEEKTSKTALDQWLTERYYLYLNDDKNIYQYKIHHKPWKLQELDINQLDLNYEFEDLNIVSIPDLTHYSPGTEILAWSKEKI